MIFIHFAIKSVTKVNIMEIFAAVITFAEISLIDKVKIAFKLFDFDGNKAISEDELFIMCRCFIEAISVLTQGEPCSNLAIKELIHPLDSDSLTYGE